MQAKLYANNYQERREETFLRAGGQCENTLANRERCPVRLGHWRITRSKQLQFEQLLIHHPNGDPENPNTGMLAVCWACHIRLHRKQGYEVIRVRHLMEVMAQVGLGTWATTNGRIGWQIGTLESSANDHIDALLMALHWLDAEVRDLQESPIRTQRKRALERRDHPHAAG